MIFILVSGADMTGCLNGIGAGRTGRTGWMQGWMQKTGILDRAVNGMIDLYVLNLQWKEVCIDVRAQ